MGLIDGIEHGLEAVGHVAAETGRAVGHVAAETGRAIANEFEEQTGQKRADEARHRAELGTQDDQRRRDLQNQAAGLRGQAGGGVDPPAITSRTNWRGKGHEGIYDMLQKTVKPGDVIQAGTTLSNVGKAIAKDHDDFHNALNAVLAQHDWTGVAADKARAAVPQIVDWGRQMGANLELTGNQTQLAGIAAQQAKDTVGKPKPLSFGEQLLVPGATVAAMSMGGGDFMRQANPAKAEQEQAVRVMEAVFTPTFVEADSTTPAYAHPVDPTAPPNDQPPPRRVDPPPGHVPPPGVPIGRGYQPAALRPSPPPSGFVPPPGLNPQQLQQQALAQQQQQQALARQQAELARQRQPMGTSQQGFDPSGSPGGRSSGGPYGGGSYGGGQYGSQSGGGVGSVPFGPLGSGGGYGGSSGGGVGAGGRYGAAGGGSGQSGIGPGGRAGVGGPGGSGEAGARGMGGAGARGAAGSSGMGMGGGAGRGGRGEEDGEHRSASYLVNADNGNEIVGDLGKVAPPVIGEG